MSNPTEAYTEVGNTVVEVDETSNPPEVPVPRVEAHDVEALEDRHRREQFAHAVAFGVPIPQALNHAGYTVTTPSLGYSLIRDPFVTDIIDADRAWMREKLKISQEQIIAQLDHDRAFAYACENPAAAVSATMNKAKVVGIADPHGVSGKGAPKRVIIEWEGDDDGSPEALAS